MAEVNVEGITPNSHKYKSEQTQNESSNREKLKPIINKDSLVSTKKPLSKKFIDTFVTEDSKDIKSWLILDVIIPGVKNTILDMLQMAFFGEVISRGRGSRGGRRDDRTNYSSYYYDGRKSSSRDCNSRRSNDRYYEDNDKIDFRNIVVRERGDAEEVIEELRKRIRKNDSASVADLFDLLDIPGKYTDNNWGWDDERDIGIRRVSSGYLIDVAEPKYLD